MIANFVKKSLDHRQTSVYFRKYCGTFSLTFDPFELFKIFF